MVITFVLMMMLELIMATQSFKDAVKQQVNFILDDLLVNIFYLIIAYIVVVLLYFIFGVELV